MSFDQILPSLQSIGLWSYWIIGLSSLLEAFFVSGIFIPGMAIVWVGGFLAQNGTLDFFDLAWFVAIGSFLGCEISFRIGALGARGLKGRWDPQKWKLFKRAQSLFQRHGGAGLVIGKFLGPVSGLVSLAAALAHMERRKFVIWNAIASVPYALVHLAIGFFLGGVVSQLGQMTTRYAVFAVVAALVLVVLWTVVVRIERALPLILSIVGSMLSAALEHPDVQAWARRHPHLARVAAQRCDTTRFQGLTASLMGLTLVYLVLIWISTIFDFLRVTPFVQTDQRLAELVHGFWTPGLLKVFTHITAFGDWRIVTIILIAVMAGLLLRRQGTLALGLGVSVVGNAISVPLLKMIFHRPRPDLAYFVETSGSFPSGHAAISVAFYGMLFYILWRRRFLGPFGSALLATTVAFLIGLSRIYLIEHYLSDVVNGYLVGSMWLVCGIALVEYRGHVFTRSTQRQSLSALERFAPLALVLVAALGVGAINFTYTKPLHHAPVGDVSKVVSDIPALFSRGDVSPTTESIAGTPLEPISLIFIAPDATKFVEAMTAAGWIRADKPGLTSLVKAGWAVVSNQADTTAPVTPYFWGGEPNEYGFQKPTSDQSLRKRHHARVWNTRFVTPKGARIFVGTASFDDGMNWNGLHHIAPNIDIERDRLITDLRRGGGGKTLETFQLSTPHLGQDVAGDPWFTDGKAVIMTLK